MNDFAAFTLVLFVAVSGSIILVGLFAGNLITVLIGIAALVAIHWLVSGEDDE